MQELVGVVRIIFIIKIYYKGSKNCTAVGGLHLASLADEKHSYYLSQKHSIL